jgi:hypothetical protein
VSIIKKSSSSQDYIFSDASLNGRYIGNISNLKTDKISLSQVLATKDVTLLQQVLLKKDELLADTVLEIKDAGIQYHRSGIGLKNKGGNDLYERLFSSEKDTFLNTKPVWYGKLIDRYFIQSDTNEYLNLDYKATLRENESVSFTKDAFAQKVKILWRQTAPNLVASIDTEGRWFRNTIQCCWVKEEYKDLIDLYYILGVFNSSYFKYLYKKIVNESAGKAFPQVKITHLRKLPIKIIAKVEQEPIIKIVQNILEEKRNDKNINTSSLEVKIDELVMDLYGLSKEEKEIVKNSIK